MMKKSALFLFIMTLGLGNALAQPSNDDPCVSPTINVVYTDTCVASLVFSWVGATSSSITPLPACNWNAAIKDVWYKFIPAINGTYNITTEQVGVVTDIILAVYTAANCSGPFTYINCDDDAGPGNMPFLSLPNLVAGTTYYIRMGAYATATADASARLCIYFTEPLATKNVGVGTQNPGATLDVNGSIKIRGNNPAPGKFLGTDNDGLASWQTLPAPTLAPTIVSNSAFCGVIDYNQLPSMNSGVSYFLPFEETQAPPYSFDAGNNLSSTGVYTVPATGFYHLEFNMRYLAPGLALQNGFIQTALIVNGGTVNVWNLRVINGQEVPLNAAGSVNIKLQAGDVVSIRQSQSSGQTLTIFATLDSRFSGYRIF